MSKRFTDTEKWKKAWFRKLEPKYKCFWFYLLDNCDLAGICDVDIEIAEIMIGEDLSNIPKSIIERVYEIKEDKWFITDFIDFQYGVLTPECRPHKAVIDKLKNKGIYNHYLETINPERKPINNKISSKDRSFIYHRDDYTCQYCGLKLELKELVIDHIIPLNHGGLNKVYNYVTSCVSCNTKKSDMPLEKYCSTIKNGTEIYKKINTLSNTLCDSLSDRHKDKEKEKEKDKDIDKDKKKDSNYVCDNPPTETEIYLYMLGYVKDKEFNLSAERVKKVQLAFYNHYGSEDCNWTYMAGGSKRTKLKDWTAKARKFILDEKEKK